MFILANGNKSPAKNEDAIFPLFNPGMSYTFRGNKEIQSYQVLSSSVVTTDIGSKLFRDIIAWKRLPVSFLSIQLFEVQNWERIIEKANVLESVSGILKELTAEQMEIFEKETQRRPFFK